jgi:hypothetical protein
MADLITVQGTNKERKVVIWEKHPAHVTKDNPEGEIFIAGEETAKVAKTATVKRLLQSGALVEATAAKPIAQAAKEFVTRKSTEA